MLEIFKTGSIFETVFAEGWFPLEILQKCFEENLICLRSGQWFYDKCFNEYFTGSRINLCCFKNQFISVGLSIGFMVTVTKPLETFQTPLYKMNFFTCTDTLLFHLEKKKIKFQRSSGNGGSLIFLLIWYTKAYDFVPFFLTVHVCNLYLTLTWQTIKYLVVTRDLYCRFYCANMFRWTMNIIISSFGSPIRNWNLVRWKLYRRKTRLLRN